MPLVRMEVRAHTGVFRCYVFTAPVLRYHQLCFPSPSDKCAGG